MARPDDRVGEIVGVIIFFLSLSTVAVALRCYCRIRVVKTFGYEDWLAIMAHLFFLFSCACYLAGTAYGTGKHIQDIPPANIPIALKWWWACEPLYVLANMALKMSIGLFLIHIAVDRYHKAIILTVIIVTEVFGIVYFFLFIFQCQPSSYFWHQFAGNGATGTCLTPSIIVNATYVYSAISCWGDWTLSIVPMFMIRRLQLTLRTKLVVIGILGLGGIASTATIVRFPYVHLLADKSDFLYSTIDVAIWSTAETGLGITAAAAITLRPLFRKFLGRNPGSGTPPSGPTPRNGDFARERARSTNPRSIFRSHLDEFRLSSDGRHSHGLTTIIKSGGNCANQTRGDSGTNVGRKGNGKNGTLWNNNATWNTSESQLACDNTCEEIGHTSSIGSTEPERDLEPELRIEVNRTVMVQSSVFNSPTEMPTSAELQYTGVLKPPPQVHQHRCD